MPSYLANLKYDQGIMSNDFYEMECNFQQLAEMQFEQYGSYHNQYVKIAKDSGLSDKELSIDKAAVTSTVTKKDTQPKMFAIKKRYRKMFSQSQIKILENIFDQNHYPDSMTRVDLSSSLNLSVHQIQVWFQNRRAKYRKMDAYRAIKKR